jgi:hypothetical protein
MFCTAKRCVILVGSRKPLWESDPRHPHGSTQAQTTLAVLCRPPQIPSGHPSKLTFAEPCVAALDPVSNAPSPLCSVPPPLCYFRHILLFALALDIVHRYRSPLV